METNMENNGNGDVLADEDNSVTMVDVLKGQEAYEEDANTVLGGSDDKECTYTKGYVKRQALYACLTCCPEARTDASQWAGICLACSLNCHENHNLVELYTKRNFRCDCGGPKFPNHPCLLNKNIIEPNVNNVYDQNFGGLYCICHRPYPDPESVEDDEMIQCIICEDWLHSKHLNAVVPSNDHYSEMICEQCMDTKVFLHDYSMYAVENDVTVDLDNSSMELDQSTVINNSNIIGETTLDSEDVQDKTSDGDSTADTVDIVSLQIENKPDIILSTLNENSENTQSEKSAEIDSPQTAELQSDAIITGVPKTSNVVSFETTPDVKIQVEGMQTDDKNDDTSQIEDKEVNDFIENSKLEKSDAMNSEVNVPPSVTNTGLQEAQEQNEDNASLDMNEANLLDQPGALLAETPDTNKETEANMGKKHNESAELLNASDTHNMVENIEKDDKTNKESIKGTENDSNEVVTLNSKEDESDPGTVMESVEVAISESPQTKTSNEEKSANKEVVDEILMDQVITDNDASNGRTPSEVIDEREIHEANSVGIKTDVPQTEKMEHDTEKTESAFEPDDITDISKAIEEQPHGDSAQAAKDNSGDENIEENVINDDHISNKNMNADSTGMEISETVAKGSDEEIEDSNNASKIDEHTDNSELTDDQVVSKDIKDDVTGNSNMNESVECKDVINQLDKKRKISSDEQLDVLSHNKKCKLESNGIETDNLKCKRPSQLKRNKGATFWPCNWRKKLCSCVDCLSMYRDKNVLFLLDVEDTVSAYEDLGKSKSHSSQYEKGLKALSSLDRIQQINALVEYNKMKEKLLDFLKSFKDKKEVVKEEDIKQFFAGMKPKREPDGVYFCR